MMKLFYLSNKNLKDNNFIRSFIRQFAEEALPAIIFHEAFNDKVSDTRFVTKRLSALLSEKGLANIAISGDQKKLLSVTKLAEVQIDFAAIRKALETVPLFIFNAIVFSELSKKAETVSGISIIQLLHHSLEFKEKIVFTEREKSLLAQKRPQINSEEDISYWKTIFEEEEGALQIAYSIAPASIAAPENMLQ